MNATRNITPTNATEQELMDILDSLANEVAEAIIARIESDDEADLEYDPTVGCGYNSAESDMNIDGRVRFYASVADRDYPEINDSSRKVLAAEVDCPELEIYDADDCRKEFFNGWCDALVATADRIVNSRI
ncbi:MAG: hypothetical protein HFJ94_10125 [Muribaculaceae bacterium]|nr:hypothetical protein [Muribaculaceae bacterium]